MVELSDPEISKAAFEQTLLMEERTRLARNIKKDTEIATVKSAAAVSLHASL